MPVRPLLCEGETAKQWGCLPSARRDNERNREARSMIRTFAVVFVLAIAASELNAQPKAYSVFPDANPPYYRVRYEASEKPGELVYGVNYTIWIPPGVKTL